MPDTELLEIKNWDKFQSKNTTKWIKDYSNREDDREFGQLTLFQRGLLEGLCRLRARIGTPIPHDATHIARSIHAAPTDRPHLTHALLTLISQGFLIPQNQQLNSVENDREEENREEERRGEETMSAFKTKIGQLAWEHLQVTVQTTDKSYPELLARARVIGGQDKILDAFESFCQDHAGEKLAYPLSAFLNVLDGYVLSESVHKGYGVKSDVCSRLIGELAFSANGQVLFDKKQMLAISRLLEIYDPHEIKAAFQEFWEQASGDDFQVKHAARKFTETAEQLINVQRARREEARKTQELLARTTEVEQLRAAEELLARQRADAAEQDLVEDTLGS
jgi:hypothetical protein